jgi:hypothetical protein
VKWQVTVLLKATPATLENSPKAILTMIKPISRGAGHAPLQLTIATTFQTQHFREELIPKSRIPLSSTGPIKEWCILQV